MAASVTGQGVACDPTLPVFGAIGEAGARYDFDDAFEAGLDIIVGGIEAITA